MSPAVLEVRDLSVTFAAAPHAGAAAVRAVRHVNLTVGAQEIVGLVGESGSGKSALAGALMHLHDPSITRTTAGSFRLGHTALAPSDARAWHKVRGRRIAMVFQDPMTALNPYLRIGRQLDEVLALHTRLTRDARLARSLRALEDVGLADGQALLRAYPHMLSGGMRQRVVIAMALIAEPELLIADEPTTALDVTVQAQILALLKGLCQSRSMALVLITHDLAVLAGIADRIAVMYAGRLVEVGTSQGLYDAPKHPYSRALWQAMPDLAANAASIPKPIPGAPPHPAWLPAGCAYAPRCPRLLPLCQESDPPLRDTGQNGAVACHNPEPSGEGAP